METNELDLLPTDELVRLILETKDANRIYMVPPTKYGGAYTYSQAIAPGYETATFLQLAHHLANRVTALQAKIDGMIPRPTIEVVDMGWSNYWEQHLYNIEINKQRFDEWMTKEVAGDRAFRITRALGMEIKPEVPAKKWICYEIHRPHIPVHGCRTQCKECTEQQTTALGMEGDEG